MAVAIPLVALGICCGPVVAVAGPDATTVKSGPPSPEPVQIVRPVRVDTGGRWWTDPLVVGLAGAVVGFAGSSVVARGERRHADRQRSDDRIAEAGRVAATGRLDRFRVELELAERRATQAEVTVRSIRVLAAVVAGSAPPDPAIAGLAMHPAAFDEPRVAAATGDLAAAVSEYGVCASSDRPRLAVELKRRVAELLPQVTNAADAYAATLANLQLDGATQAALDAEQLQQKASARPARGAR